jgi:IclR family transcriptional regulator, acetate operon repressor
MRIYSIKKKALEGEMVQAGEVRRLRGRPRAVSNRQSANTVQALDRALSLLRLVADSDGSTLTELSQRAGMAPSTAHRLLLTLESQRFVENQQGSGDWVVGVEAFRIGSAFIRRTKVASIGREKMRELMEGCGETVNLGIADDGDVVFISQVETHEPIRAFFRPGTRGPLHASSIGKALLAYMSSQTVRQILQKKGLAGFTPNTIIDPKKLSAELDSIRKRGWAVDDEEKTPGMRCVAAPVFDVLGEAVAAISISGPTVRMTLDRTGELGPQILRAADAITRSIGGRRPGS